MKNKIKEVQKYFTNKIVKGEYTVKYKDHLSVFVLTIDKNFTFSFWIGEHGSVHQWNCYIGDNLMELLFSEKENTIIHDRLYKQLKASKAKFLKKEKLAEYEKLKAELGK